MAAPNRGRGDDAAANRDKRDRVIELDASPERVAKPDGYLHDDKRVLSDIISELVYVNYASDRVTSRRQPAPSRPSLRT